MIYTVKNSGIGDMKKNFAAVVYKEKKLYVAECPEAGTASQGKTIEEALSNLKEATELYLEEFPVKQIFACNYSHL